MTQEQNNINRNMVTLTLTVPALEKLFENDPEIALKLRYAAVAEFTRRKIGETLTTATKTEITAEIARQVGKLEWKSGIGNQWQLAPGILESVKSAARNTIDDYFKEINRTIKETVEETVKLHLGIIENIVKKELEAKITAETRRQIDREIRERMSKVLAAVEV